MKNREEIIKRIQEIESLLSDPDTGEPVDDAYLDEGDQAELSTLYWVIEEEE